MTRIILQSLFWFALAIVFAALEIENEGRYGWAERMPTWYRTDGVAAKIYGMLMGGKPLTGYHMWMFFLPLFAFHVPFVTGTPWSLKGELMVFALYLAWAPLWDYLWFVLNPHYGVANFSKTTVWWHAKSMWVAGVIPFDYVVGWFTSVGCAVTASWVGKTDWSLMKRHGGMMMIFLVLTGITIVLAPLYHSWYSKMRARDDRGKVHIFHTLPPAK